jgi:predicted metal-binding membrane protein
MKIAASAARAAEIAPELCLLLAALGRPPHRGPMLAAATALIVSLTLDRHVDLPSFCGAIAIGEIGQQARLVAVLNAPDRLALAWVAMLIAMMTPLIAIPLAYVRGSSLPNRQWRAACGFLLGYFSCWVAAGPALIGSAILLRLVTGSAAASFAAALALALLWSASPVQQAAQNRSHRLRRIGLFGLAADRDCIRFGAIHGGWCVAICWPWMLVTLTVAHGHVAVMLAVAAIVLAERMRRGGRPHWRLPLALSLPAGWIRRGASQGRIARLRHG